MKVYLAGRYSRREQLVVGTVQVDHIGRHRTPLRLSPRPVPKAVDEYPVFRVLVRRSGPKSYG